MFLFRSCLYLVWFLMSVVSANGHEEHVVKQSNNTPTNDAENGEESTDARRPIIHTYWESLTDRGMTDGDHQALLDFWTSSWEQAGWQPVVLTRDDASKHADYTRFVAALHDLHLKDDYCEVLFVRWLAMAQAGGGWMVDYDVFPLQRSFDAEPLPNDGQLTVHGPVAPSLASGSAQAWLTTAWALLDDAKQKQSDTTNGIFWTDTLGIINLLRNKTFPIHSERHVAEGHLGLNEKEFSKDNCHTRPFRNKWVVHFGPLTMQRGVIIPGELRLPKHRVTVAKEWLPKWYQTCGGLETVVSAKD